LSVRQRDFVVAARALGAPPWRVIIHHIVPTVLPPLTVSSTVAAAQAILAEAGLSYLGFGVPPPDPSWGNMLSRAQSIAVLAGMPWLWIPPGLAICITVLAVNLVGDGLRDALDPRQTQRQPG
jgi:peptide/nickel transport system permease protein